MSIYNQEHIQFNAKPNSVHKIYVVKTLHGEPEAEDSYYTTQHYLLTQEDVTDQELFTFKYHKDILKIKFVLFLRDDSCDGVFHLLVFDEAGSEIPGQVSSCSLHNTPVHSMEYVFDTPLPANTIIHFGLKTCPNFTTKNIEILWINMSIVV